MIKEIVAVSTVPVPSRESIKSIDNFGKLYFVSLPQTALRLSISNHPRICPSINRLFGRFLNAAPFTGSD